MCTPLAGGALGWGLSQRNKPEEKNVTNNYFAGSKDAETEMNKDSLKAGGTAEAKTQRPQGPSQSSRSDKAY